jgi:glucose-6-phosphate isomerase
VQSVVWDINPFDQWGVELGKKLAERLAPAVRGDADATPLSASLARLVAKLADWRRA